MSGREMRTPRVVVVGAGPAGLVASLALVRYGVSVMLVEKRDWISSLSRAVVISTRSMELLRSWGLEEAVRAGAADVEPLGWQTPALASGVGSSFPLGYPTADEAALISPTRPAWAPQDQLEPLLLHHLQASELSDIRFGTELVGLEQHADRVAIRLCQRSSGQIYEVPTAFAIGADGAHSTLRSLLDIALDGSDDLGEWHQIQFTAPLAEHIKGTRYGLNVITDPQNGGVLAPRGCHDRWFFSREWHPGELRLTDMAQADMTALIAAATGVAHLQPRIERAVSYRFAAQLAERYRRGRAFLVGDAAHRMTPRGGTGMNTAIHDAFDIGWKLAWSIRGWATADLLETYEAERRPVGEHNVARSADRTGAQQTAEEALPWDLNGRLPHAWVGSGSTVSTLDLLGEGLTLMTGRGDPGWTALGKGHDGWAPVTSHVLNDDVAQRIGIPPQGAALYRPDGRPVARWPSIRDVPVPLSLDVASPAGAGPRPAGDPALYYGHRDRSEFPECSVQGAGLSRSGRCLSTAVPRSGRLLGRLPSPPAR